MKKVEMDKKKEGIVCSFLDKYLYTSSNGFSNEEREYSKERQLLGVDLEFDYNGRHYVCDEKAATDYIGKGLGTFVLELSSLDTTGKFLKTGWFLKEDNINDSYLFVWLDGARDRYLSGGSDDITECEVCLVRKEKLVGYLKRLGWDREMLMEKANAIRYYGDEEFYGIYSHGYKFSYSTADYIPEHPINILLTREVYRSLSDFNKVIKLD